MQATRFMDSPLAQKMTVQDIAEAASHAMHAKDHCAQAHGMAPIAIGPGHAKMSMTVRKDMVNGHNICHGGMIFALADTCFAHACNSYNNNTVASGCMVDFINPAKLADILTAEANERSLTGRTGVYDVIVTNQDNDTIAFFRGRSYRISGHLVPKLSGEIPNE